MEAATALLEGNEEALSDDFLDDRVGMGKSYATNFEKRWWFDFVEFLRCGGSDYFWQEREILDAVGGFLTAIAEVRNGPRDAAIHIIQREVRIVAKLAERLTLRRSTRGMFRGFDVSLDGQDPIWRVTQYDTTRFSAAPIANRRGLGLNAEADGVLKARMLAALDMYRSGIR